jgi:hypothetical protein
MVKRKMRIVKRPGKDESFCNNLTADENISASLAIIVQDLQLLERRMSLDLPANHAVAAELGISLEAVHEYLKRREIFDFISGMRRAGRRMSRSLT